MVDYLLAKTSAMWFIWINRDSAIPVWSGDMKFSTEQDIMGAVKEPGEVVIAPGIVKKAAVLLGFLSGEKFDRIIVPEMMTHSKENGVYIPAGPDGQLIVLYGTGAAGRNWCHE